MPLPILMPPSGTLPVTWHYTFTATAPISLHPAPEVKQRGISSSVRGPGTSPNQTTPPIQSNGPIYTVCKTLRHVMASAAETKLGSLFYNSQQAVPLRQALNDMGHPNHLHPLQRTTQQHTVSLLPQ